MINFGDLQSSREFPAERAKLLKRLFVLSVMGIKTFKFAATPFCGGKHEIERRARTAQTKNEARKCAIYYKQKEENLN